MKLVIQLHHVEGAKYPDDVVLDEVITHLDGMQMHLFEEAQLDRPPGVYRIEVL